MPAISEEQLIASLSKLDEEYDTGVISYVSYYYSVANICAISRTYGYTAHTKYHKMLRKDIRSDKHVLNKCISTLSHISEYNSLVIEGKIQCGDRVFKLEIQYDSYGTDNYHDCILVDGVQLRKMPESDFNILYRAINVSNETHLDYNARLVCLVDMFNSRELLHRLFNIPKYVA